jgi:hypothetical protein
MFTGYNWKLSHQTISFVKSGIRIFGYICLLDSLSLAAFVLIVSEVIGVLEEVGEK